MERAVYLQMTRLAAYQNFIAAQLDQGTGYLVHHPRIMMPEPRFTGNTLTLNYISVRGQSVNIKTETIQNLDAGIGLMENQGNKELAALIKELTEAVNSNNEINNEIRNEIAEQLDLLVAEVTVKPEGRSRGVVKALLTGIKEAIAVSAGLLSIWEKVEPLMRLTVGT